jgi:signal peptidase II
VSCLTRGPVDSNPDEGTPGALWLVLGGAAGNLTDRLWRGYVTDFVHVFHGSWQWHDFSLAEVAISVGVALLVLSAAQRR